MSNRAWMPLHIGDYLSDTGHLSAAEHGAYMLLIMHYWQKGELPSDEGLIRRIAKLSCDEWAESRSVLAALFLEGWRHKRIDEELAKADDIIAKRKAAGRQRGSKSLASAEQVLSKEPAKADTRAGTPITNNLSDANASDAGASNDPRAELFDEGAKTVQRWTGKSNAAARSFIGKLLKAASDDCISVLDKIRTADAERMVEPIAWVAAAVIPRSTSPPGKQTLGSIWTSEAKSTGILHDTTSTTNGRLDEGDAARHRGGADAPQHLTIAGDRARH